MSDRFESVRNAYDEVADTYADYFRSTEGEAPLELAMIAHFVALLPQGSRVLDAGCGAGRMLPLLARHGAHPVGVDLSPGMIRRAQLDHPEFETQVASLDALPFDAGSFDGVFSWYSLIHADDEAVAAMLSEARRVLAANALLLVGFQVGTDVREVGGGFRERGHAVEMLRFHRTRPQMAKLAARAGFTVVADMQRAPVGSEKDPQAVMIFRRD